MVEKRKSTRPSAKRPVRKTAAKPSAKGASRSMRSTSTNTKRTPSRTNTRGGNRSRSQTPLSRGGNKYKGRVFRRDQMKAVGPAGDKLRIIVLGGNEEVGRNCTLIEYKNDIVLIDMGLQFPDEDMPGIDYIIPNMSYLKGKEKNIRGVIITHGHYDHIGAIPHTIPNIGNPPVYALPVAAGIIKKRQTDFKTKPLNLKTIKIDDTLQLGQMKVHFVHINHNIPDSAGIIVETPEGTVVHTGDWKFDFHPAGTEHADFQKIAEVGKNGVLCLMGDSTNAIKPGHQLSEKVVGEELHRIIEKAEGRVIVGTFASLLSRVKQIIESSEKLGRKVVLEGYSMRTNVEIAKELGFIKANMKTFIKSEQANKLPDNKVTIICTGAQGESNAALHRIAANEHRNIRVNKNDTIIFSSSVIPGNENSVQRLMDTLYRRGANVINYQMMDVHAGGHAQQEDIKLMLALFKPKYYVPIEGNHFLLRENAKVAQSMGWTKDNTFVVDNGQIMEFKGGKGQVTKQKVNTDYVFVDGLGVADVTEVVLRDRKVLAEDGMVIVLTQIEGKTGKLVGKPDIVSRGFIYMKENLELIDGTRKHIMKAMEGNDPKVAAEPKMIRDKIRDEIGLYLFKKTQRRPMILPVIIEV